MNDDANKSKIKAAIQRMVHWCTAYNLKNVIKGYYSMVIGLIGGIIIFCMYAQPFSRKRKAQQSSVKAVWLTAVWFLLWLPVPIQAIGLFCFFSIPFLGLLPCDEMIMAMFNEMLLLMFIGNYLSMLLNCSGIDKRLACWLLCTEEYHTTISLASRTMMAAFFLAVISNRMIVTVVLIEMVVLPFDRLSEEQKEKKYSNLLSPFNYESYQAVLCSAITSSATIGSFCIQHHNISLMLMRALFAVSGGKDLDYPDIFNYLMFSFYSFPIAIVMFILNYSYYMMLAARFTLSKRSVMILHSELRDRETNTVREWDCHQLVIHLLLCYNVSVNITEVNFEWRFKRLISQLMCIAADLALKLSVILFIFMMLMFMTRWCSWLDMGWASERHDWASHEVPGLKDATTAACFLVLLHLIPNTCNYLRECNTLYVRDLPQNKPASSLLFWKTNHFWSEYPILFMIGTGLILLHVTRTTKLDSEIWAFCEYHQVTQINEHLLLFELLGVYVISVQFMNGIGTHALSMPFLLLSCKYGDLYWPTRLYTLRTTLAAGFASSLGFMAPHKHHPVYYSRDRGHVRRIIVMLCGFGSALICFLVLYVSLTFLPKLIWDPRNRGLGEIPAAGQTPPTTSTTTETPITTTGRKFWWWNEEALL